MAETQIAGLTYRIEKLDARKQFHVARRLTPVMSALAANLRPGGQPTDMLDALGPMSEAIAHMKDEDADYVLTTCLSGALRANEVHGTGWSPVVASNGRLMFQDIDMGVMLQIVWAVIQENLGGFFSVLASTSGSEETSPPA